MVARLATVGLAAALLLTAAPPGSARQPPPPVAGTQRFDIDAQPLEQALRTMGAQARLDLLYENNVVTGQRSRAVVGTMTRQAALETMLGGTGLLFRFTSPHAALVFPPDRLPAATASGPGGAPPRMMLGLLHVGPSNLIGGPSPTNYESYGQALRTRIDRLLSADPRISGHAFRVELAVRVDAKGAIQSLTLVKSTGDQALDAVIRSAVEGATLAQSPPASMPQPIWFELASQ